ncbi:hypothetical protein ACHAPT_006239 [Fusarium lateritium]
MKTTPLILLSLGVLASTGPVPEGIHLAREVAAADANGLAARSSDDKSASSRRKGRALGARNRRIRRRQRQFRRDDDWTDGDDTDDEHPAPAPAPAPAATSAPTPGQQPQEEQDWTDNDGHYTSCDEFPGNEHCSRRPHVQTTQKPAPVATTEVKAPQPTTKALGQDGADWETDCDSDWTDDGEHERCKTKTRTKTKITPITTTTAPKVTATTPTPVTTARPYGDDTDNADYLTDCDSDWSDEGERQRCTTRVVSVTPTATGSARASNDEPVQVTNAAAGQPEGANHAIAIAGLAAAAALVL